MNLPKAPLRPPPIRHPSSAPKPVPAPQAREHERFSFFWKGSVFSNWHMRPMVVDDVRYNCGEQFMMAEKARLFGDSIANHGEKSAEHLIMQATAPGVQKALGKAVKGFVESVWKANDVAIVRRGLLAKAEQHPDIYEQLMATEGTTLVEASPYDRIWGIGLAADDRRALDRRQWRGENKLGFAWTDVREELAARLSPKP